MIKININRNVRIKFYHEIFRHVYDIMVWNEQYQEETYTPMDHLKRYTWRNYYCTVSVPRETISNF